MKPKLHVVSFSGGKDSTAMLLRMLDEGMPVDVILFCDTGLEFPAMYDQKSKVTSAEKSLALRPNATMNTILPSIRSSEKRTHFTHSVTV